MKHINDENIDEIMFQLLEGEITGQEREHLLSAIHADEKYRKLWTAWQQTILPTPGENVSMDIAALKKRTARIIPFNYKYAIAAMLVLGLGLSIFLINRTPLEPLVTERPKPKKTTQPVLQVPKPEIKTPYESREDSAKVPLKDKIRNIAVNRRQDVPESAEIIHYIVEEKKSETPQEDDKETFIVQTPDPVKVPVKQAEPADDDPNKHIIVTMSSNSKPSGIVIPQVRKESLLTRLFGQPKIKLENDSSTRTNKKLIIENKQYRIIAGF